MPNLDHRLDIRHMGDDCNPENVQCILCYSNFNALERARMDVLVCCGSFICSKCQLQEPGEGHLLKNYSEEQLAELKKLIRGGQGAGPEAILYSKISQLAPANYKTTAFNRLEYEQLREFLFIKVKEHNLNAAGEVDRLIDSLNVTAGWRHNVNDTVSALRRIRQDHACTLFDGMPRFLSPDTRVWLNAVINTFAQYYSYARVLPEREGLTLLQEVVLKQKLVKHILAPTFVYVVNNSLRTEDARETPASRIALALPGSCFLALQKALPTELLMEIIRKTEFATATYLLNSAIKGTFFVQKLKAGRDLPEDYDKKQTTQAAEQLRSFLGTMDISRAPSTYFPEIFRMFAARLMRGESGPFLRFLSEMDRVVVLGGEYDVFASRAIVGGMFFTEFPSLSAAWYEGMQEVDVPLNFSSNKDNPKMAPAQIYNNMLALFAGRLHRYHQGVAPGAPEPLDYISFMLSQLQRWTFQHKITGIPVHKITGIPVRVPMRTSEIDAQIPPVPDFPQWLVPEGVAFTLNSIMDTFVMAGFFYSLSLFVNNERENYMFGPVLWDMLALMLFIFAVWFFSRRDRFYTS